MGIANDTGDKELQFGVALQWSLRSSSVLITNTENEYLVEAEEQKQQKLVLYS